MAAVSKAQRVTTAIAEHEPSKLYKRNRGMLKMKKKELHKYAITKESGLPERMSKHYSSPMRYHKRGK